MTDYKALRETLERLVIHRRDGNITSDYFFANFEPMLPQLLAALRWAECVPEVELEFAKRAAVQREWLNENAPYVSHDQKHLDADTEARAYWHYGYAIALGDVLKFLQSAKAPT